MWAKKIVTSEATLQMSPNTLLAWYMNNKSTANQKRSKQSGQVKRRRQSSNGSDSESDGRLFNRQFKQIKRQLAISLLQSQLNQTAATAVLPLQYNPIPMPTPQFMFPPSYMPLGYGGYPPQQSQSIAPAASAEPARVKTPPEHVSVPSSSPVNGNIDTRKDIVDFFDWITPRQPDDLWPAYAKVQDVVVGEGWTVDDIKAMADRQSPIYAQAIGEPYNLKEGIIRHLRQEFSLFKQEIKAQAAAAEMAATAGLQALFSGQ
ncbi:hypothetical protein EJ04DRAFT_529534 [Polyplosphaeria fusca]|uniref:Uncharacterized protein n=1 Tax=Polyplosphaeria fusca TaxID=682080 RepID=A0A9P4QKE3_9PLEO|nr:hypothetical protein EJ04DRAFT_529534 [Polyplosphaeria fusca]